MNDLSNLSQTSAQNSSIKHEYYGDLNGDKSVDSNDVLAVLQISSGLKSLDDYSNINGKDRRLLAYAHSRPTSLPNTLPTALDALEILRISSGIKPPILFIPQTIVPSFEYDTVFPIESNWSFNVSNEYLYFKHNEQHIATIIPKYANISEKTSPNTWSNNDYFNLSNDNKWQIAYPNNNSLLDGSQDNQLKFLYDGFLQIVINASEVNGTPEVISGGIDFGPFWKIKGTNNTLIFFYSSSSSSYFRQVEISIN